MRLSSFINQLSFDVPILVCNWHPNGPYDDYPFKIIFRGFSSNFPSRIGYLCINYAEIEDDYLKIVVFR